MYPASVEYLNRQGILPKFRRWTLGATIYIYFFPFSLFVSVYVYASLCNFDCIALLLPFALGFFCLSISLLLLLFFFSIVFSTCYHWWIFLLWLLSSFFLCFFIIIIFNNYFLFFILITFLFYFIFSFFLSFFLPFLLSHVTDRVLLLWLGVRTVPLKWESRVQDIGPPETSQLHVISNGESSPRDYRKIIRH